MLLANRATSITVLVTGSSTAAVLLALCGSTAIITSPFMHSSSPSQGIWRGGQCNFRQSRPLLSHFLAGVSKDGPQAVREPEHPPGDGSRLASEPALLSASGSQTHRLQGRI